MEKLKNILTWTVLLGSLSFIAYAIIDYKYFRQKVDIDSAITVESDYTCTVGETWPDSTIVKFIKGAVTSWIEDCESRNISTDKVQKLPITIKVVSKMPSRLLTNTEHALGMLDEYERTIYVLKAKWDPIVYKTVVYHELGHYLWKAPHSGVAGEILYEIIDTDKTSVQYYKNNWTKLVNNYFRFVQGNRDIEII